MAYSPHVSVRLSPSMLASLECIAARAGAQKSTFAGEIVKAYVHRVLAENHWEAQAQDYYRAKLDAFAEDDPNDLVVCREELQSGQVGRDRRIS